MVIIMYNRYVRGDIMDNFIFAFNALAPLLLLAAIGMILRNTKMINQIFVNQLNGFIFTIALPVMIFVTLATAEDLSNIDFSVLLFVTLIILVIFFIGYFILKKSHFLHSHKPVLLQNIFRGNFVIIGMPLALRLGGQEALAVLVILNAFMVPLTNLLSFLSFRIFKKENTESERIIKLLGRTFFNPIMIAVYLGLIVYLMNGVYETLTSTITILPETLDMLAGTVTPMALIAIGAQFKFNRVKELRKPIIFGVVSRMIVVPLFGFISAYLLRNIIDFSASWVSLIALFASPVALASVAVTKGMDGDDELASQLVIIGTAFSMISLFFVIVIFRAIGLL